MSDVTYTISLAGNSISNSSTAGEATLVSLECTLSLMVPGNSCRIEIRDYADLSLKVGDDISIAFESDIFTGTVYSIAYAAATMVVTGYCSLHQLHRSYDTDVLKEMSAGDMVSDICGRVGVNTGTIASGPQLYAYRVHHKNPLMHYLLDLSTLSGCYLQAQGDGTVRSVEALSGSSDHTFVVGEDIIALDVRKRATVTDGAVVYGEGSASSDGQDKGAWLPVDISSVKGTAQLSDDGSVLSGEGGDNICTYANGAIRTGEAASAVAEGILKIESERTVYGSLTINGNTSVTAGELCSIENNSDTTGVILDEFSDMRIREVRHRLNGEDGFVSELRF